MPVSSSTEHWIKPDALTINLNHFGDPDYLQVSVLAGAVVMAFKQDVIGYNAAHNYRTWPLQAANTYLETTSAYHVYARLTRSEVNASALVVYDPVLRDIEGRSITIKETEKEKIQSRAISDEETDEEESPDVPGGSIPSNPSNPDKPDQEGTEILGDPDPNYFYVYLGKISASVDELGYTTFRTWEADFRAGSLNTNQYQNEEGGGEFSKMFKWNKVTDLIEVLKVFSSAIFKKLSIKKGDVEKPITDIKRSTDSDDEFLLDEKGEQVLDEEGNPINNPEYVPVNDETIPTTAWVKKNSGEDIFLRKDKDDRSVGNIASDKSVEVGTFVAGMIGGYGSKIYLDENGKAVLEADKIVGREELIVPTITFNTIEVVSGDKANTFAYGRIKEVEILDAIHGIITLDLLEGEYGTVQGGDIMRGIFHNLKGGNSNKTKVDGNGFLEYSGFFTSYFTATYIVKEGAGEMQFRYELQTNLGGEATCAHPCASMKFFAYGNRTNKERQSITYENREYRRRLVKMSTWAISSDNIAMQDGNLDNLVVGGFEMNGYGTFQTNSYIKGVQIQFTPDQLEEIKGQDAYSVTLSAYDGFLKVNDKGEIASGVMNTANVVAGNMNVTVRDENDEVKNVVVTTFALKTTIQASRGSKALFYSKEVVTGAFDASIRTIGCAAKIDNGVVVVTDISNLENCCVMIDVSCEARHNVTLTYQINAVYDGKDNAMETIYSKVEEPAKPANVHPYKENVAEGEEAVWTHEASEDNIWMAVATKQEGEWGDWQVTRVKGFDAVTYKISPENTPIKKNMIGTLMPDKYQVKCYRIVGKTSTVVEAIWQLQALVKEDGKDEWINLGNAETGDVFTVQVNQNKVYENYRIIANPTETKSDDGEYMEVYGFASVLEDGATGQMPRYCGIWKSGVEYVWDENYRDIVIYEGNAYQVGVYGSTVQGEVFNADDWNAADKFDFVAMNTALIDNANIAGFTFNITDTINGVPYGELKSQGGRLILDSLNSKVTAINEKKEITFDASRAEISLKYDGKEVGELGFTDGWGWLKLLSENGYTDIIGDTVNIVNGNKTISVSGGTVSVSEGNKKVFVSEENISVSDGEGNQIILSPSAMYAYDNKGNVATYDASGGSSEGSGSNVEIVEKLPPNPLSGVLYVIV